MKTFQKKLIQVFLSVLFFVLYLFIGINFFVVQDLQAKETGGFYQEFDNFISADNSNYNYNYNLLAQTSYKNSYYPQNIDHANYSLILPVFIKPEVLILSVATVAASFFVYNSNLLQKAWVGNTLLTEVDPGESYQKGFFSKKSTSDDSNHTNFKKKLYEDPKPFFFKDDLEKDHKKYYPKKWKYFDELEKSTLELVRQRLHLMDRVSIIDNLRFILAVGKIYKTKSQKIGHAYQVEYINEGLSKNVGAFKELKLYIDYYDAYIADDDNRDAFLKQKHRQKFEEDYLHKTGSKFEFHQTLYHDSDFMNVYAVYDLFKFKLLEDLMDDDDNFKLATDDIKSNAEMLMEIEKTKLSVIHLDILVNILHADIILNILDEKRLTHVLRGEYLSSQKHKEQYFLEMSDDFLTAFDDLVFFKSQLNRLNNKYHGVEYESSKFLEVNKKLKAMLKESMHIRLQLSNLARRYLNW